MATKKLPPFMGKETPSEEKKEMQVKKRSPAMYRAGEKAEGVHGKNGMMKPSKYAEGGAVAAKRPPARGGAAGAGDATPGPGRDGRPTPPQEFKKYASGGMVPDKSRMGTGAMGKGPGYAKGGYVRSADGCCQRGKTKGTFR